MALEITWTQTEVDQLKAAIASGVLIVEYSGPPARRVQYQSIAAMREALKEILAQANSTADRPPYKLASHRKGL